MSRTQIKSLIRMRSKQNPFEVVLLDPSEIRGVMTEDSGSEILTRFGMIYVVAETPDEVAALVEGAFT